MTVCEIFFKLKFGKFFQNFSTLYVFGSFFLIVYTIFKNRCSPLYKISTLWTKNCNFYSLCISKYWIRSLSSSYLCFWRTVVNPIRTGWGAESPPPPGIYHLLCLEKYRYELQTSWQFQVWSHWSPSKVFFWISSNTF